MTNRTTDPSKVDALLRQANTRRNLLAVPDDPDDGTEAQAAPVGPRPGPLPGGAAQSSLGMAPPDPDKWIRAAIDAKKFGTPMPAPQYLTRDA